MHELGIVFYIIKDVKEAASENGVRKINSVTVELGEVSTVIPYYLEDCWKWAVKKEGLLLRDSKLIIEKIPAVTYCEDCKKEYGTVEHGKICPYCKSEKTYLIRGNEVMIKQVEAVEPTEDDLAQDKKNSSTSNSASDSATSEVKPVSVDSGMKMTD